MASLHKILFLHGFTSSGSCEIARTLKSGLDGFAELVAPDIPLHPYEAIDMLADMCMTGGFDLIVGSSCGSFYGQQLVRPYGLRAILVCPFLKMTDFLAPRMGRHEYKSPREDGNQHFEITPELVAEFDKMQREQFGCYDEFDRDRVWGMFGSHDTLARYRDEFKKYYSTSIDYDGPHTMTGSNVERDLIPAIKDILKQIRPQVERYFTHFKGNKYRMICIAKDSETLERKVVYQALYGGHGYWVRPERMFFERIERDGRIFPRFAEILYAGHG